MTILSEQDCEVQSYTLRPNQSLDWRMTKRVFFGFAACMTLFGAYWIAQGAWLVLPFFGLELAVLGLGLYLSAVAGSRREVIELAGSELRVLRGGRLRAGGAAPPLLVARGVEQGPHRVVSEPPVGGLPRPARAGGIRARRARAP
jgi:hypothetical protein